MGRPQQYRWLLFIAVLWSSGLVSGCGDAERTQEHGAKATDTTQAEKPSVQSVELVVEDTGQKTTPGETEGEVVAGHSYHGEAFNEGPRQAAYFMEGTGDVHFPIATPDKEVQRYFDQGLGQLFGFWYFEAERTFRQAASIDPDCAMLYWGMAQANTRNNKRAKQFIAQAVEKLETASEIEKLHINAYAAYINETDSKKNKEKRENYIKALKAIVEKFPDEYQSKALLALYRWEFRSTIKLNDDDYKEVEALLQTIFEKYPAHPAHHFRIHLWDTKDAKQALTSAAICGQGSPRIAHMWHMPGHIYSKVKRFDDAAWQQEASARVDHANMMRDRVMPDQIHNFAHNNEWLVRDLINIGRVSDALDLAQNMTTLPRHPKYNNFRKGSSDYGRQRSYDVCFRFELWDKLLEWTDVVAKDPQIDELGTLEYLHARGVAFAQLGKFDEVEKIITDLDNRLTTLKQQQDKAGDEAAEKELNKKPGANKDADEKVAKKDEAAENSDEKKDVDDYTGDKDDADKDKKDKEAVAEKKDAGKKESSKKKKSPAEVARETARRAFDKRINEITPSLAELRAVLAIKSNDKEAAEKHLKAAKSTERWRLALYYLQLGNEAEAEKIAQELVDDKKELKCTQPLAVLAYIQHQRKNKEAAEKTFNALRDLSAHIELSAPPFARLAELAASLNMPADWRKSYEQPTDVGVRPPLSELGPFRWQPSPALPWTLSDANGKPHSLEKYKGRPVIVIFYLGYGCVHCTEQLAAFAPVTDKFKEAGIELIGISTDTLADLNKALEPAKATNGFPFPLVADPSLSIFKKYRAFDDFEKTPLHGTYLVDANGMVCWQDISFEPFMDTTFLLKEAKRLLALKNKLPGDA